MLENEMDFENRIIAPEYTSMEDSDVETSLRPKTLSGIYWPGKSKGKSVDLYAVGKNARGSA